ncbi:MAG: NnrU family protein, partial [Pseudomonadota bacterium]
MTLLILGLLLWWATHLLPVFAPAQRAALQSRLGEGPYKGLFALVTIGAVALMVIGYQRAEIIDLWYPPAWLTHLNNLLMLLAVIVFVGGSFPSHIRARIRHGQFTGLKIWAIAHLLVNGDLSSVVLFGGLLAWAVVALIGTNRRDGPREALPEATGQGTIVHVASGLIAFLVVGSIHGFLAGVWPFPA